jgi:hypothetical protein
MTAREGASAEKKPGFSKQPGFSLRRDFGAGTYSRRAPAPIADRCDRFAGRPTFSPAAGEGLMSKATHQIFKRIVLHNKLLSEPEVDALLAEVDDPEHAIGRLVERHTLTAKAAEQFLAVYKKQVDKLFLEE